MSTWSSDGDDECAAYYAAQRKDSTMTATPDLRALAERLEGVARQATAGPWKGRRRVVGMSENIDISAPATVVRQYVDVAGRRCTAFVAVCDATTLENDANAAHIAALNPHTVLTEIVPALRLAVEREEENARLEARWNHILDWLERKRLKQPYDSKNTMAKAALAEMARLERESPLPAPPARLEGEK